MPCRNLTTDLSCDDAQLILEPYFQETQALFVESGLPKCSRTRLYVAPWVHDSPRHFAACAETGREIIVAPELAELPEGTVAAIFAHELGHAADFLYPGEFAMGRDGAMRRRREDFTDSQWAKWMSDWATRDDDTVEIIADAIAERATQRSIGYVGPCQLQCFDRGNARPAGLR